MNLQASYFSITNPLDIFDRWLNPYRHNVTSRFRGKNIKVAWTQRAEYALSLRTTALIVEMQIYFSCVVKKRVLFHEQLDMELLPITDKISIISRAVQSDTCSAEEFARNYPVKRELTSEAATKMRPRLLQIDYVNQQWLGDFSI